MESEGMMANGGGYGRYMEPSGTKVRNTQTDKSQYSTYVIQAIVFAIAGDIAILLVALFFLAVGWIGLFAIVAAVTLILGKRFPRFISWCCAFFGWEMPSSRRIAALSLALIASFIGAFFFFASGWWEWLIARDEMLTLILETVTPLLSPFSLPPLIVYLSLIGLWFVAALKKFGTVTITAIVGVLLIWTITSIKYTVNFAVIWSRARYLGAAMLVPPPVAFVILCYAMGKEMIAPNLNFILDPISWIEFVQAGGLPGLVFPRYVEWKKQLADRRVRVAVEDGNGNLKIHNFMDVPGMHNFARAVLDNNVSFNEAMANRHLGYGRVRWEKFRDRFMSLGHAVWKDPNNHKAGVDLLCGGKAALRGALPHPASGDA